MNLPHLQYNTNQESSPADFEQIRQTKITNFNPPCLPSETEIKSLIEVQNEHVLYPSRTWPNVFTFSAYWSVYVGNDTFNLDAESVIQSRGQGSLANLHLKNRHE